MAKYLYLDGVDDLLTIPAITHTKLVVTLKFTGKHGSYGASIISSGRGYALAYLNGAYSTQGYTHNIEIGKVSTIESTYATNGDSTIFSHANSVLGAELEIYEVIVYSNSNIIAHYDMSTGTVQDQSGNGNPSAILSGGEFRDDGGSEPTEPPMVVSVNPDRGKISNRLTQDKTNIRFEFDQDVQAWEVRVLGSGQGTGFLADSGGNVAMGTEIVAEIDSTELQQEGQNKVNIYGQNSNGDWTPYTDG